LKINSNILNNFKKFGDYKMKNLFQSGNDSYIPDWIIEAYEFSKNQSVFDETENDLIFEEINNYKNEDLEEVKELKKELNQLKNLIRRLVKELNKKDEKNCVAKKALNFLRKRK
jgi:neutral trehalase